MLDSWAPVGIFFVLVCGFGIVSLIMSYVFGVKKPNARKLAPYECGVNPIGTARERFSVKFYLVAMLFLLFDIEAVFLIPWAVVFRGVLESETYRNLKWVFYGEMMVFMVVLFAGLVYVWRKGILEWNR